MKVQLTLLGIVAAITVCSANDLVCPEQFDPMNPTFQPHPDCTKYYVCNWQDLIERSCPNGLHWNQRLNYCDYPNEAGCVGGGSTPDLPGSTTTTPSSPAKPSEDCPEVYDPSHQVYFPHDDCSKYYICTYEGNKLEQNCPSGLHWSQASGYCDRPEAAKCEVSRPVVPSTDVPSTEGTEVSSTEAPSTTQKPTTEAPALECPQGESEVPVFLPHADCSKYYMCVHGHPIELNCPPGTFWNAAVNVCDNPTSSGCHQQLRV